MGRVLLFLVFAVTAAFLVAGCGGGSDSITSSVGDTTLAVGRVTGTDGEALPSATVTVTSGSGQSVSTTTRNDGSFTLGGVPVGVDFALTVTPPAGQSKTWNGLRLELTDADGYPGIYITMPLDIVPAGSNISITPFVDEIEIGTSTNITARVRDSSGQVLYSSYPALWIVVGDIPADIASEGTYSGKYLSLSPVTEGTTARITANVILENGSLAKDSIQVTAVEGVTPPPPPPLPPSPPG